MDRLLIRNAKCVITCDDARRQLEHTDIAIEEGMIVALGQGLELEGARILDASGMWVYPGLVNLHHHFYQVLTRNIPGIQGFELFDWLVWLYERWRHLDPSGVTASSLVAMGELVKSGCTTMVDHHYVFPEGMTDLIDRQFEAAEELGVRLHACRGSMSLGRSAGGLPPDDLVQTPQAILDDSVRLIERYHDPSRGSYRQVILAPCSPFSVDAELLVESAKLARRHGVRLHTHLAETRDEDDYCLKTLRMRPLAYMERVGWVGEDVFYAHGIHFNDAELKRLAETGTGVAHCPVSNMKLASGIARVSEMIGMGIPVGLGVDGSASNDGSNLLAEIRTGYLLQRLRYNAAAPSPGDLLWMATRGGARILGRDDIGSLEVGKCADLFMVDSESMGLAGCQDDPEAAPATVGLAGPVEMTLVGGRIVYERGRFTGIDEETWIHQVNSFSQKMR